MSYERWQKSFLHGAREEELPKIHLLPYPGVRCAVSLAAQCNILSTRAPQNPDLECVLNLDVSVISEPATRK